MLRRYKLKNYNFRLVILLIAISIIGVLLIGSADSADQKKQAIGVVLGVVIMIIVSLLDYSWLLNFYWVLYIGNLMMLGVLYLGGSTAKNTFGATRWIQLQSYRRCSGFRFSTGTCASACHYAGEFPASGGS